MMKSMTGFGRYEKTFEDTNIAVELRSVNHRYLNATIKLPRQLSSLEPIIKKRLSETLFRGNIDVTIEMKVIASESYNFQPNIELAKSYYHALSLIKEAMELTDTITLDHLLSVKDILSYKESELSHDTIQPCILEVLDHALYSLGEARISEGKTLEHDILRRIHRIEHILNLVKERVPQVTNAYRLRLKNRIEELIGDIAINEERITQEVIVFADRVDISEEITRMESHLSLFRDLLKQEEPLGRKLEFLLQEMNREVNTAGSKSQDVHISHFVVEIKSELEKVREQVQNIE
ncbi:MAG: YicC/YloC family endoribonuclease [Thermodesulfobacteriota bacterium]|nr:YicC/YloC family endoribonuclease [Thermodesulfobacteriota bacterium]